MADKYVNRVKIRYNEEVIPALVKTFSYKNVMQVPRLEKITLNMRLGDVKDNAKSVQVAVSELEKIAGQKIAVKTNCAAATKECADVFLRLFEAKLVHQAVAGEHLDRGNHSVFAIGAFGNGEPLDGHIL